MNYAPIATILTAIFDRVAGDWTIHDPGDRNPYAVRADGLRIWAHMITYGTGSGRLSLDAGLPEGADYSAGDYSGLDRPEITVNPQRDLPAVARDVERRLIPKAHEYWTEVSGRIERRLAAANSREVATRALAEVLGGEAREARGEWRAELPDTFRQWDSYCYGDFKPNSSGSHFNVEIHNLPVERAHELAALIKTWA